MARGEKRPPVGRFGGVRMVQRRIGRSETLLQHKEAVAQELIALSTANITDIMNLDGTVKPMEEIPDYALRAIKRINVSKDGALTIEMHDKVATLRVLAKAAGFLDSDSNQEKPSIVAINMHGPAQDVKPKEPEVLEDETDE